MLATDIDLSTLAWEKVGQLMPVIIQDHATLQVLMLGYMNQEALQQTLATGKVTFYSRSKKRLWTKGETSGNELTLVSLLTDCDQDALLLYVKPSGPACHLNTRSCFGAYDAPGIGMLAKLSAVIAKRYAERPANSYVSQLFTEGTRRIAQKVGEEGVEVALAGVSGDRAEIINEAADLLFHLLVLLQACQVDLQAVLSELERRA